MTEINSIQARILTVLIKSGRFMSTREVAQKASISWNTADAYLKKMLDNYWVEKKGRGTSYWKAIVDEDLL